MRLCSMSLFASGLWLSIMLLIFSYIVIRFYFLFLSSIPFMDISQFVNLQVEIAALFFRFYQ